MEATEFFSSSFRILSYFADSNSGIFSHFSGLKNYFCKVSRYKPKPVEFLNDKNTSNIDQIQRMVVIRSDTEPALSKRK